MSNKNHAIECLFRALESRAPSALEDLQTRVDTKHVAAEWAAKHHLTSDAVIEFAKGLRAFWRLNPGAARELHTTWRLSFDVHIDRTKPKALTEWEDLQLNGPWRHNLLPSRSETLRQWLIRATKTYREMEKRMGPIKRTRKPTRDHLALHCEWFIDLVVNDTSQSRIAAGCGVDRTAVHQATARVSSLVGVPLPRKPRGKPPKGKL